MPGSIKQLIDEVGTTFGGEYMTEDYIEYTGPYYRIRSTVYPGVPVKSSLVKMPTPLIKWNSELLFREYIKIKHKIPYENNVPPVAYFPAPTPEEYKLTRITRYFCRKRNLSPNGIIEIDKTQYDNLGNKSKGINIDLYIGATLTWSIQGTREDKMYGDMVMTKSVANKNLFALINKEREFPGIGKYLSNLTQFAQITE